MCGIAGILHLDGRPAASDVITRMCQALAHRGPDGEGVVVDGPVGLGHRRLAIIDLSDSARQPMAGPDGRTWISYNGEIYNFRELRAGFVRAGARFRSQSDTEVLLHAYGRDGLDCVASLNGMFAFALWDGPAQRLLLARDRFGVKPLYYRVEAGRLIFASEIKAILAVMEGERRVSPEALTEYFTFQNVLSDLTLFEGIRILRAGHVLVVDHGRLTIRPYWDLVFAPEEEEESRLAHVVRETFEAAVERHLVSDVPLGSHLSGGMDSASIVSVASRHIPRLMTFTGGFDLTSVSGLELAFDERKDADLMAERFQSEHHETVLHAGDLARCLPRLVWHLEDPRVGISYQNYYLARLAGRFVRVVLAGVGGDEIFAGYPWRYGQMEDCWDEEEFEERYYRLWCRLIPDAERRRFFTPPIAGGADLSAPREVFRGVLQAAKGWHPLDRALYFDAKTFLHGLLVVEDKLSMAHSVETRVPFLDAELVALACRIPPRFKFAGGTGKRILRQAMTDVLPRAIVAKPKQGFSPPDESWYRGATMGYIQEILLSRRCLDRGYVEPVYVRRVVDEHVAGRVNHRLLLWSLLVFEWWNRIFIDEGDGEVANMLGGRGQG